MNILAASGQFVRRLLRIGATGRPDPASNFWYSPIGYHEHRAKTAAGAEVSSDAALQVSTVYACVRVLAESLAQLPVDVYRRLPTGKTELVPDHPVGRLLSLKPNVWQSGYEFLETQTGVCALRGNSYALKLGQGAVPDGLIPLSPDRMRVEQIDRKEAGSAFRLRYRYRWPDHQEVIYTQDQVLHLRGFGTDGVMGLSPMALARNAVEMAKGAERLGVRQFSSRPMLSGILSHPNTLTEDAAKRMAQSFRSAYSGEEGWHGVAVLEEGMTWHQIGMTNADAEFLQTRKFQVTDIARWFRVPPHMVADLDRATFSNIEQMSIEFVTYTLMPWIRRWESMLTRSLLVDDSMFVKIRPDALLRGTTEARYKAHGMAIKDGWKTRNEVRDDEDLNALEGLDEPLRPLNMAEEKEAEDGTSSDAVSDQPRMRSQDRPPDQEPSNG